MILVNCWVAYKADTQAQQQVNCLWEMQPRKIWPVARLLKHLSEWCQAQ
jgi:hypothetical protein